jgi:hypothetical protein
MVVINASRSLSVHSNLCVHDVCSSRSAAHVACEPGVHAIAALQLLCRLRLRPVDQLLAAYRVGLYARVVDVQAHDSQLWNQELQVVEREEHARCRCVLHDVLEQREACLVAALGAARDVVLVAPATLSAVADSCQQVAHDAAEERWG